MDSKWAMEQLEAGKKVRMSDWPSGCYIKMNQKSRFIFEESSVAWHWNSVSISSNDWEPFLEPKKTLSDYCYGITATDNNDIYLNGKYIPEEKVKEFIKDLRIAFTLSNKINRDADVVPEINKTFKELAGKGLI